MSVHKPISQQLPEDDNLNTQAETQDVDKECQESFGYTFQFLSALGLKKYALEETKYNAILRLSENPTEVTKKLLDITTDNKGFRHFDKVYSDYKIARGLLKNNETVRIKSPFHRKSPEITKDQLDRTAIAISYAEKIHQETNQISYNQKLDSVMRVYEIDTNQKTEFESNIRKARKENPRLSLEQAILIEAKERSKNNPNIAQKKTEKAVKKGFTEIEEKLPQTQEVIDLHKKAEVDLGNILNGTIEIPNISVITDPKERQKVIDEFIEKHLQTTQSAESVHTTQPAEITLKNDIFEENILSKVFDEGDSSFDAISHDSQPELAITDQTAPDKKATEKPQKTSLTKKASGTFSSGMNKFAQTFSNPSSILSSLISKISSIQSFLSKHIFNKAAMSTAMNTAKAAAGKLAAKTLASLTGVGAIGVAALEGLQRITGINLIDTAKKGAILAIGMVLILIIALLADNPAKTNTCYNAWDCKRDDDLAFYDKLNMLSKKEKAGSKIANNAIDNKENSKISWRDFEKDYFTKKQYVNAK